jgi:hypothetical protein
MQHIIKKAILTQVLLIGGYLKRIVEIYSLIFWIKNYFKEFVIFRIFIVKYAYDKN